MSGSTYKLPFVCLRDTRSKTFQYKINERLVLTNKRLYIMKLFDFELCSFCGIEAETPEHLFTERQHACTVALERMSNLATYKI